MNSMLLRQFPDFLIALLMLVCCAVSAQNVPILVPQLGHSGAVIGLDVSPDGSVLATGGTDHTVRLWDAARQRELRVLMGHTKPLRQVRFSPDGALLASAGVDGNVRLWRVDSGMLLRVMEGQSAIEGLAFSSDGRLLATAHWDAGVRIWNIGTGKLELTLTGHAARVYGVSFSPDGKSLASVGKDQTLLIWDLGSGSPTLRRSLTKTSHAVTYSPNGKHLAFASGEHDIQVLELATEKASTLHGHSGLIQDLRWAPDGTQLVSASLDKSVRFWSLTTDKQTAILRTDHGMLWRVALAPDSQHLYTAHGSGDIFRRNIETGLENAVFNGRTAKVFGLALSRDGRTLVSAGDETLTRWDLHALMRSKTLALEATGISSVALLERPLRAVYGTVAGSLVSVDLVAGSTEGLETQIYKGKAAIHAVATDPAGHWIAAGDQAGILRTWMGPYFQKANELLGHHQQIFSLAALPDGRLLSGGKDKTVRTWSVQDGHQVAQVAEHQQPVTGLATHSMDSMWASAGWDQTVRLKRNADGPAVAGTVFQGGKSWLNAVAISADGQWLAAGSSDRLTRLWRTSDPTVPREMVGHEAAVHAVAFSWDGRWLISAGRDTTIRFWDLVTFREALRLLPISGGGWVALTPDGHFASSGEDAEKALLVRWGERLFDVAELGAYRERFFRPDVVQAVLAGSALTPANVPTAAPSALTLSSVAKAPEVSIVNAPSESTAQGLALSLSVKDQGGGVGEVRAMVNGSLVATWSGRGAQRLDAKNLLTLSIPLEPGDNLIRVVAFNREGSMRSEAAEAKVIGRFEASQKPRVDVLAIGIDEFRNPRLRLSNAAADARSVAEVIRKSASGLFARADAEVLDTPEKTTRDAVLEAIRKRHDMAPTDVFVFFMATHGIVLPRTDGRDAYYLFSSEVGGLSDDALAKTGIDAPTLRAALAEIPARKKLLIFDACYAGALGDWLGLAPTSRGLAEDTALRLLSDAMGSTLLSAAASHQQALEGYRGHGLFTWVLVDGLNGRADGQNKGYVTTTDLGAHVELEVPRLAKHTFGREQFPVPMHSGRPFPLVSFGNTTPVIPSAHLHIPARRSNPAKQEFGDDEQ